MNELIQLGFDLIQFGLSEEILARQRELADTMYLLYAQGWTPSTYYAELNRRGVWLPEASRLAVEASWQLWQEQQAEAIPVEMPELEYNNRV